MKKVNIFLFCFLAFGSLAGRADSHTFWSQLEKIRQFQILGRVILDSPEGVLAKKCQIAPDSMAEIGARLQLKFAEIPFENFATLDTNNRKKVIKAVANCKVRASCLIYSEAWDRNVFENWAASEKNQISKITKLALQISSDDYARAAAAINKPCELIQAQLNQ